MRIRPDCPRPGYSPIIPRRPGATGGASGSYEEPYRQDACATGHPYHPPMTAFGDDIAMLIERGGWVMVPLFALSVVSLGLIFERTWFWTLTHRPRRLRRLAALNDALRRGDEARARGLIDGDRSPFAEVARRLLRHGATEAVAVEIVEAQRPRLDRFMVTLSTIVTAAPLLGILGTVIGIIQSFRLLGEQSTLTDPRDVSAGIAAALLTTALGLVVALITLFPYMVFRSHVDRALGRLESVIAAAQQGEAAHPRTQARTHPRTNDRTHPRTQDRDVSQPEQAGHAEQPDGQTGDAEPSLAPPRESATRPAAMKRG